jgi:hypothetical protein
MELLVSETNAFGFGGSHACTRKRRRNRTTTANETEDSRRSPCVVGLKWATAYGKAKEEIQGYKKCPFYTTIEQGSESDLKRVLKELDLLDKPHVKWKAFQV